MMVGEGGVLVERLQKNVSFGEREAVEQNCECFYLRRGVIVV